MCIIFHLSIREKYKRVEEGRGPKVVQRGETKPQKHARNPAPELFSHCSPICSGACEYFNIRIRCEHHATVLGKTFLLAVEKKNSASKNIGVALLLEQKIFGRVTCSVEDSL
jgi:hypothetical protein